MSDAAVSRTILDGPRNVVILLTSVSDGTGEAGVVKVDVSTLLGAPATVSIQKIHYSTSGMIVTLLEDATTDVRILDLNGDGEHDFTRFGGIPNSRATGFTGDILLTTTGHTNLDTYWIVLEMTKQ